MFGDWDCDGEETPGLFRRPDGYAYLRNSNTPGLADVGFYFGDTGDIPLGGDLHGDGLAVTPWRSTDPAKGGRT